MAQTPIQHSLRVGVVGLGQGGGNLAAEFHRRGYAVLAINTASADLRALHAVDGLPVEACLDVGVEGSDGAGKDPEFGRACLQDHADGIRGAVTSRMKDVDLVLLCAGLGGGTGSCVADLWTILQPTGLPLAALVTLPAAHESGIAKVNAVRAADAIVDAPLNARMVVDNALLHAAFTDTDVLSFHRVANAAVVEPLDAFNRLGGREELRSLRSFDGEDLRKVLLGGGVLVPSVQDLPARGLGADTLVKAVLKGLDGGGVFARGAVPERVALLAVVIVGPEETLRELRAKAVDDAEAQLKEKTGGAAVYLGMYAAPAGTAPRLMVLASSTELPRSVKDLLADARREGGVLSRKIHEELPRLDTSDLGAVALSRAPAPARLSRPPPAGGASQPPRPRPIQSQVPAPASSPPPPAATPAPSTTAPPRTPQRPAPATPPEETMAVPPPVAPSSPFKEPLFTDPGVPMGADAPQRGAPVPHRGPPTQVLEQEAMDAAVAEPLPAEMAGADADGDDLQKFYDDLVEKFRTATDRKARERVGRRLMEDARSPDDDIRALAVWAMVAVNDRGFRRALQTASKDANVQVRDLAVEGIKRLGDEPE